jgi:hypothetical protein
MFAEKAGKLYGSYEIVDGRLKMALGVKRLTRPLEFAQATDAILLDVTATTDPIPPGEKRIHAPTPPLVEPLPGPTGTAVTPKPSAVPNSLPQTDPPAYPLPAPRTPKGS